MAGNLELFTSSSTDLRNGFEALFRRVVNKHLLVRRMYVVAAHVLSEEKAEKTEAESFDQLDLFTDVQEKEKNDKEMEKQRKKEKDVQKAMIKIKEKYGKNSVLKGFNYEDGATARIRNGLVGGHKE